MVQLLEKSNKIDESSRAKIRDKYRNELGLDHDLKRHMEET